jgi:hypothetical protein
LKACAVLAQKEALGLVSALGGVDNISEQRLVLIQDVARLGLVLRAVMARFLQGDGDPELASRVASITSARRSSLVALGLERVAKELDLNTYQIQKAAENRAQATIDTDPDALPVDATPCASRGNGGDVPGGCTRSHPPAVVPNDSTDPADAGE